MPVFICSGVSITKKIYRKRTVNSQESNQSYKPICAKTGQVCGVLTQVMLIRIYFRNFTLTLTFNGSAIEMKHLDPDESAEFNQHVIRIGGDYINMAAFSHATIAASCYYSLLSS